MTDVIVLLLSSLAVFWIGYHLMLRLEILDRPGKDVPKRKAVPTMMGIVLLVAFFMIGFLYMPAYFNLSSSNPFLGLFV
jgi:UDP-N-acetylmuramyl pentapeptide phosphotransferase/UDP-N-acetylglucosamine-1-phosphate transferase